jgi:hypothetical protein
MSRLVPVACVSACRKQSLVPSDRSAVAPRHCGTGSVADPMLEAHRAMAIICWPVR